MSSFMKNKVPSNFNFSRLLLTWIWFISGKIDLQGADQSWNFWKQPVKFRSILGNLEVPLCRLETLRLKDFNFTKSATGLWVFFTFFKFYKWCQLALNVKNNLAVTNLTQVFWVFIETQILCGSPIKIVQNVALSCPKHATGLFLYPLKIWDF